VSPNRGLRLNECEIICIDSGSKARYVDDGIEYVFGTDISS
jgi:hypothetical protein